MKRCPYCAEDIQDAAIKCRYCGSFLERSAGSGEWSRRREGRMLGGVCAGLATQFGLSVTALRLAAVLLTLLGFGWGVVIYAVLWAIMPIKEGRELLSGTPPDNSNRTTRPAPPGSGGPGF